VFCHLVVLVKLPSDWLERTLWGSLTVARDHLHKAQAEESLWLCWLIVFFHCFSAWYLYSPRPYVIYFLLLWHDIAYLCWKCRKTPTNWLTIGAEIAVKPQTTSLCVSVSIVCVVDCQFPKVLFQGQASMCGRLCYEVSWGKVRTFQFLTSVRDVCLSVNSRIFIWPSPLGGQGRQLWDSFTCMYIYMLFLHCFDTATGKTSSLSIILLQQSPKVLLLRPLGPGLTWNNFWKNMPVNQNQK